MVFHYCIMLPYILDNSNEQKILQFSQAQQGLLSPLFLPRPFPWSCFRLVVHKDSQNLVCPFMRVTNQMTRHLATLRETQLLPPLTRAKINNFSQSKHWAEIILCSNHNNMFLLIIPILLNTMSSKLNVKLILFTLNRKITFLK